MLLKERQNLIIEHISGCDGRFGDIELVNKRAKLTRVLGETALKSFHPRLYKIRYFIGASWSVKNGYYCGSKKATFC